MPYFVNKTDGSIITVLDGTKDTTTTSIVLFGRLVQNYGDQTNENFVRLLENFSYTSSPANPISGQLWFDRNTNNIKVYTTDETWVTVGSVIQGNVDISGNLEIGATGFAIKDTNGNIEIINSATNGNVSFYSNTAGTVTRVLHINGSTGQVEVSANATNNFGLTTKLYVDSQIQAATSTGDTSLQANVAIINANLVARINAENDLRANITAANVAIALRDTIARVDSINFDINNAIQANIGNLLVIDQLQLNSLLALEAAMVSNVAAANSRVDGANINITAVNNRLDSVNTAIDIALVTNLAVKADTLSPTLSGVPLTTTAPVNTANSQIASSLFVMNTLGANILPRIQAVNTAMIANVAAANALITTSTGDITSLNNRLDAVNLAQDAALQANLSYKANLASPVLTGIPQAPTATFGSNSAQIATTQYVDTRGIFWDGSRKFVSTTDPSVSDGDNGDVWFKYIP
jgi:hypothetical protein